MNNVCRVFDNKNKYIDRMNALIASIDQSKVCFVQAPFIGLTSIPSQPFLSHRAEQYEKAIFKSGQFSLSVIEIDKALQSHVDFHVYHYK